MKGSDAVRLDKLIKASHSAVAARGYRAFTPSEAQRIQLQEVGIEVLRVCKPQPGACALMSAAYVARLQQVAGAQAYAVAGTLSVWGKPVFGDGRSFDGAAVFSESNASWDGHVWVMFGPFVADASICRTARSAKSPPVLAAYVREEFGEATGLLIARWSDMPRSGLTYAPQYVLTEDQVTALALGAMRTLT